MAITERLALLVTLDANGAIKGFNDLGTAADRSLSKSDQRLDRLASGFKKAGAGMLAGAGLAAAGLYKAGQAAGDLEQAMGGTQAVFGEASGVIDEFAKKAAQAAGLSESAFRQATTSIGGQLKGLGFSTSEAADQAVRLTQVAADLSATYGGTTAEAVAALGAAFRGEADPAERFNLFLNQTRVNAKAVEMGLAATTSSVDANAKAQAVLALVTEQSADALGQFQREGDTAQGAMARFSAEAENAKASLGQSVAPILADIASAAGDLAGGFQRANEASNGALSKVAAFGTIGLAAAGGVSYLVGKVIDLRENLGSLAGRLTKAEGGLTRLGKAGVVIGGAVAIAGLRAYEQGLDDINVQVDDLNAALGRTDDESRAQVEQFFTIARAAGQLDDAVRDAADSNVLAAERLVDYAAAAGVTGEELAELRQIIEEKRESDIQGAKDQEAYAAEVDKATESTGHLAAAVGEAKTAMDLAKESTDLFKEGLDLAFKDLTLEEAVDRRASALSDLAERFAAAQVDVSEARRRVEELLSVPADERSETWSQDVADAQARVREAVDATSRALDGSTQAALTNREDIRGIVDDIAAVIELQREQGATLEELRTIRDLEKIGLEEQLTQLGFNREEIARYIEAIDAIPLTKATTVTVDTATAEAKIKRLLGVMSLIPGGMDAAIADKNLQRLATADRRAIGGPVTAGMTYSTNEYLRAGRGFEIFTPSFVPPTNGTISAAGSAYGTSLEQTVNIYNPLPETPSASARHLRRAALEVA